MDYYNLSLTQIAEKAGLTAPKTLALIKHLRLCDSNEYFKEIRIGKSKFNRYSRKALEKIKEELPKTDMKAVWEDHKPRRKDSK